MGLRVKVLAALVLVMFATLTTRLWFLQVLAAEQYQREAKDNAVRLIQVPAPRGVIKDANGEPLVDNRASIVITINRQDLGDQTERVLFDLSKLLDIPADELGARLDDPRYYVFSPVPVAIDVPRRVAYFIKEHTDEFPGVDVLEVPVRRYPLGSVGAHVLGYLGQISKAKLRDPAFADYEAGDLVGVSGIEAVYERDLAGTQGLVKYRVNSAGENLGRIGEQLPVPGNDVTLTIDAQTQQLAEESLKAGIEHARTVAESDSGYLKANAGAAIVLDPQTGAIEAMASYPSFDPSVFTRSISQREFDRRFGQANGLPLLNRAIQGQYAPGSTYKPFIAASALQRDIVTTGQSYGCPPSWTAPFDESDPDAMQYVFNNWTTANLGYMSVAGALARSCDTIFYPMGYRYWDLYYVNGDEAAHGVVSHEPLQHDLKGFGFGAPDPDRPSLRAGRAGPRRRVETNDPRDVPGVLPGGRVVPGRLHPHDDRAGRHPRHPAAARDRLRRLGERRQGMRAARPGPGRHARATDRAPVPAELPATRRDRPAVPQVRARRAHGDHDGQRDRGGRVRRLPVRLRLGGGQDRHGTGTPPKQDTSWFAAMTAAGGQEHVVVVMVEQGGHGATTAAPIARNVIEGLYGLQLTQFLDVAGTD